MRKTSLCILLIVAASLFMACNRGPSLSNFDSTQKGSLGVKDSADNPYIGTYDKSIKYDAPNFTGKTVLYKKYILIDTVQPNGKSGIEVYKALPTFSKSDYPAGAALYSSEMDRSGNMQFGQGIYGDFLFIDEPTPSNTGPRTLKIYDLKNMKVIFTGATNTEIKFIDSSTIKVLKGYRDFIERRREMGEEGPWSYVYEEYSFNLHTGQLTKLESTVSIPGPDQME